MNISIIGAGPVGCYAGYLLAKSGHRVSIYENHGEIGSPVQCTGLLTSEFDRFNLPKDSFLVNTFSEVEVNSPQQKTTFKQKEYLICRKRFDNYLADLARKVGVKIFLNHSFLRKEGKKIIIKDVSNNQEKVVLPDLVIAADGPLSPTAKAYGLFHPRREHYYGLQATVKGNFDPQKYSTYFGGDICPGFFAWVVPESSTKARVGVASRKNTNDYFNKFLKEHHFQSLELQAGTIPIYHPQQILYQDNCYLLGDAAGFVKATTGGGIIPGMKQAEVLVNCLNKGENYERKLKPLKRKLHLHLQIRAILNKFSDKDWDKLVSLADKSRIKKIIEEHSRENPFPLLFKTLLNEPRFLSFGRYIF